MEELVNKVQEWSIGKGLNVVDPRFQYLKVMEELGEIGDELMNMKNLSPMDDIALLNLCQENLIDAVGDTHVTLIILAQQLGIDYNTLDSATEFEITTAKDQEAIDLYMELVLVVSYIASILSRGKKKYMEDMEPITNMIGWAKSILDLLAINSGTTSTEGLAVAYGVIAERTGELIDGIFVKSEDLKGA